VSGESTKGDIMTNDNPTLARRWFEEVWTQGREATIDELMASRCLIHGLGNETLDKDGFKKFHHDYRDAFPDVKITVDQTVSEGDLVAVRWSGTGTHTGGGLGFDATNKPARFGGMTFIRIQDGKLIEGWNIFDQFGMLAQLGKIQLPA
jgi:steroid delta-isomerase-like uncharacterized protein